MWRVVHQYMDTMNGPADFLETPKSPITGTMFENAASTKMVHIAEFTADLIRNGKLNLDPSRNDHHIVTWHDSCNTARGMGLLEEPRYVLKNVCNNFVEMPPQTIRENTFCCGSGSGLNAGENMELRMRGGLPRANAVKYVHDHHGVNTLGCVCAIDRAALPAAMDYWCGPEAIRVAGLSELVANALVMEGENSRQYNLRGEEVNDLREEVGLPAIDFPPEEGEEEAEDSSGEGGE
jgi:Fe-S oxidoreductase